MTKLNLDHVLISHHGGGMGQEDLVPELANDVRIIHTCAYDNYTRKGWIDMELFDRNAANLRLMAQIHPYPLAGAK